MINSKIFAKNIASYFLNVFIFILLINLQTTIWFHFFNYLSPPYFWMPFFVYMIMYRSISVATLWFLTAYFILMSFTMALPGVFFVTLALTFAFIIFMQKRFSMLSLADFVLITGLCCLLFPICYFVISAMTPYFTSFSVLDFFLSFALTLPITPILLVLLKRINALINGNNLKELQIGL